MSLNPLWPEPAKPLSCQSCAWSYRGGRGKPVPRCRRHGNQRIEEDWPACQAHTETLDCVSCGACCREAYHTVEVSRRDPFRKQHPELMVSIDGRPNIKRKGPHCAALKPENGKWVCQVYADRPKTCRDFEQGGNNCVDARRRLGLTP